METPVSGRESLIPGIEIDRLQKSMEVGQSNEPDDMKFVCDLSTLLVATIQEAKDRISQVEYIFCSQLYPTFQKNSKSLQKLCMEARKAAEDECKEMHRMMIDQIDELYLENEKGLVDKENMIRKISELEEKLSSKDVEIEKGKELQSKLQQAIESLSSDVDSKQKLLRQYEERLSSLFTNTRELEEEICQLKEELVGKNEDLSKGKDLQKEILTYVSSQGKKILRLEELLQCNVNERKTLELKLENVESCINDLRIKFGTKTIELEESRKVQEQLVQKIDVNVSELTKKEQLLSVHEKEKALLLSRLKDLENKNDQLQVKDRDAAFPEKSENYKQLVQKIESKHSELLTEKQKRKDLINAYKSPKSQYNFLCAKSGLTAENTQPKHEAENDPHSHNANKNLTSVSNMTPIETTKSKEIRSSGTSEEQRNSKSDQTPEEVGETTKVKKEMESGSDTDDDIGTRLNQASVVGAPFSSKSPSASKWKTSRNSSSFSAGGKRPAPHWRVTRSRQTPNGPDPHDDFLDTPLENIRGNLAKALREEEEEEEKEEVVVHNIPAPVSRDMECDNLDDEAVLDIDAEAGHLKEQAQGLKRSPKAFKYVEPVRKKAQREALRGIECKQCKKFYDAVIPDGEGKNTGEGKNGFRCEHLDGVSRHRYRYAPPMTPEGFWNIGFDSEV